ncbi:hypothetical protein RY831_16055 [Noviherbaspirillum sp. CPCC 100848]|uniref:Uncharacterized protein n=1 Tax=Noviherbaspirillum album TaxID=3080276 RepID=A0ABU6JAK1_9BURK|nr:hypothetical protein [Noviherbaspirillum sp. CPCC 100848]
MLKRKNIDKHRPPPSLIHKIGQTLALCRATTFNGQNNFLIKISLSKSLNLKGKNFAFQLGNLLKPAPRLTRSAVKQEFSTKLSTDFVDIGKKPYES